MLRATHIMDQHLVKGDVVHELLVKDGGDDEGGVVDCCHASHSSGAASSDGDGDDDSDSDGGGHSSRSDERSLQVSGSDVGYAREAHSRSGTGDGNL